MVSIFPFSEPKIKARKPPAGNDPNARDYHKDAKTPGLQVCVTGTGSKTYYFVRRIDGRPTRVRLGTTIELSVDGARKAAAKMAGKVASGENPHAERRQKRKEPTLKELYAEWMIYARTRPEKPKGPKSLYNDKLNFETHCKPLAARRLGAVRKGDIEKLHRGIGERCGHYAANRTVALLKAMYYHAIRSDDIAYNGINPCCGVRKYEEPSRDRFLQQDEAEAFFKALYAEEDVFRDFFLISLLTGARKSNVLSMKWEDVKLDGGYWRIPTTKNRSVVVVPLVPAAVSVLESRRAIAGGSPWVFPGHRRGDHLHSPKHAWERVLAAAKLDNLRMHDLRRTLGSWMTMQNVSLTIVGKALGHRSPQATAVYARLAMDPTRQGMAAATTALLGAAKRTNLLTIDVEATEVKNVEAKA